MAVTVVVAVVTVVTVLGVIGVCGGQGEKMLGMISNPYNEVYARPPVKSADLRFPGPSERRVETSRRYSSRVREEESPKTRKPRYSQGEMYFLPVRFDLNRDSYSERSMRSDDYQPPPSPRLIMDKDFNIRFDNPYIIPLTKPLALVLDSAVKARHDGYSGEKMMIPFPVLVKARKPLLEQEGFRDYRDDDDVPEHRSYDEEDSYVEDSSTLKPTKKVISVRKHKKNGTTTYHNTVRNEKVHKASDTVEAEASHEPAPEGRIVNRKVNVTTDQNQEEPLEDSSDDEVSPPDPYPGKIFAEMYHKIPTYPFDSIESQEFSHKYEGPPTKKYSNEVTTEVSKPLPRPRVKSASKYPISSQMFSASTDFEWVTQANSTKARKVAGDETNSRRIIIHEVLEQPLNTTIQPFIPTPIPQDAHISEQFWRQI